MTTATQKFPKPGKLPNNTPIKQLGFPAAEVAQLTPAAQKLTKGDLLALQKWSESGGTSPAPDHLTVADINSLQKAFSAKPQFKGVAADVTACCCCCPCCSCTAAAEIAPVRTL